MADTLTHPTTASAPGAKHAVPATRPCPLCGTSACVERAAEANAWRIVCDQCVAYTISTNVLEEIASARKQQAHDLGERLAALSDLAAWTDVEGGHLAIGLDTYRASPFDEQLPVA